LLDWVNVQICLSDILENWRNCCFHWATDTLSLAHANLEEGSPS
jgi:hypothetical protein